MSRYIDAEFLQDVLRKKAEQEMNKIYTPFSWSVAYECVAESIDVIPTADVEPVRHGHWIVGMDFSDGTGAFICSLCGHAEKWNEPYCNCGAKMDEKENTDADTV